MFSNYMGQYDPTFYLVYKILSNSRRRGVRETRLIAQCKSNESLLVLVGLNKQIDLILSLI